MNRSTRLTHRRSRHCTRHHARPYRYSATLRPSIEPSSRIRCTKVLVHGAQAAAVVVPRNPIVGSLPGCCARATSGHAATAPPSSDMNSRRAFHRTPPAPDLARRAPPAMTAPVRAARMPGPTCRLGVGFHHHTQSLDPCRQAEPIEGRRHFFPPIQPVEVRPR
jgi:hypothetical protein